jgi:acetoin:2,6-dichlorophenolindophenol oxidoreductase subunit alpha
MQEEAKAATPVLAAERLAADDRSDLEAAEGAALWLALYRRMLLIRGFEHAVDRLYKRAVMPGLTHLYVGQEAVAVGICSALRRDDLITSTHRGHGHCIAKGAEVDRMFAELLGKASGYCRGKGGSMHIADFSRGNLGANAIVGGSTPIATGAALSARRLGTDRVVASFFGEGALGQGVLYESMNMAALWKLPVIYVCENNLYSEYTRYEETTAGSITARAAAFGIPTAEIDGQDVLAVRAAAEAAVARGRAGEGPTFLVCATYRWYGHHVGDIDRAYYRPAEEEARWRETNDPIKRLEARLAEELHIDADQLAAVGADVDREIEAGMQFGVDAPNPDPAEVDLHVFA